MSLDKYISPKIIDKYEFHNYGHALEILAESFPDEWNQIQVALQLFSISFSEIVKSGGNESPIPKKFDNVLYPFGWREIRISGDLHINIMARQKDQRTDQDLGEKIIKGYIDGHNIDFLKGRVAFDLEWNSKDQTFDRDLLAMRTYFDCGLIDVGVIVTRSGDLNELFRKWHDENGKLLITKYGASTTWMGKLLYRLESRRNGGCPILAVGIKRECIDGYQYYAEGNG